MKLEHQGTFGGGECSSQQECQSYTALPNTNTYDQDMLTYNLHDQSLFPSLQLAVLNHSFCYEPEYSTFFTPRAGLPAQPRYQFRPSLYYDNSSSFSNMPYPSRNRPSTQLTPVGSTVEPMMMFKQEDLPQTVQPQMHSSGLDLSPPIQEHAVVPVTTAPPVSPYAGHQQCFPSPLWQQHIPMLGIPDCETSTASLSEYGEVENDEEVYDKPYAQLIYDALIQAPGHRMLLRDIYDWFIQNTRKAIESGTNGWQNSIRHNLSMNKVHFVHHLSVSFTNCG